MRTLINCLTFCTMILFVGCGTYTTLTVNLEPNWGELHEDNGSVYGVPFGYKEHDGFWWRVEPFTITTLPVLSYDSKVDGGSKVLVVVFPENVICGENLEDVDLPPQIEIRKALHPCKIAYTDVGMTYYTFLGYGDLVLPSLLPDDNQTAEVLESF